MELPYVLEGKNLRPLLCVEKARDGTSLSLCLQLHYRGCYGALSVPLRTCGAVTVGLRQSSDQKAELCFQRDVSASRVRLNAQVLRIIL